MAAKKKNDDKKPDDDKTEGNAPESSLESGPPTDDPIPAGPDLAEDKAAGSTIEEGSALDGANAGELDGLPPEAAEAVSGVGEGLPEVRDEIQEAFERDGGKLVMCARFNISALTQGRTCT